MLAPQRFVSIRAEKMSFMQGMDPPSVSFADTSLEEGGLSLIHRCLTERLIAYLNSCIDEGIMAKP